MSELADVTRAINRSVDAACTRLVREIRSGFEEARREETERVNEERRRKLDRWSSTFVWLIGVMAGVTIGLAAGLAIKP